jgi:hypothetical protein
MRDELAQVIVAPAQPPALKRAICQTRGAIMPSRIGKTEIGMPGRAIVQRSSRQQHVIQRSCK